MADVAVKKAFNRPILSPLLEATGRLKRIPPASIKKAKLKTNIWVGLIFFGSICSMPILTASEIFKKSDLGRFLLSVCFGNIYQLRKTIGVIYCHFRQHFAIYLYTGFFKAVDKPAIGNTISPSCSVDSCNPQLSKISLFKFSTSIRMR